MDVDDCGVKHLSNNLLQTSLQIPLLRMGVLGAMFTLCSPVLLADVSATSEKLARQLGDSSFAARSNAEQQLLGIGYESYSAIVEASESDNPEIRYRAQRLLKILMRDAFANYQPQIRKNPWRVPEVFAPGWEAFQQLLGDGADSRNLYLQILNSETDLMLSLNQPGWRLQFEKRCSDLQAFSHQRQRIELQPGAIAALLFLAAHPENQPSGSASAVINMLLGDSNFRNAAERSQSSGVLKSLVGIWIRKSDNSSSIKRLNNAAAFELDAAMDVAREAIKNRRTRNANSIHLANSIFYLAKYGEQGVIEELEALLNDQQQLQRSSRTSDVNVQIRDVALVALLHVTRQNPKKYGYHGLRFRRGYLYIGSSARPASAVSRENAIRTWRQWRAINVREPVPNHLDASEGQLL